MRYTKFFPQGQAVSTLCLGTAGFGTRTAKEDAFSQMDLFFEKGGAFFDTARVYGDWVPGGRGASEKTVGAWIKERKCRDKVLISTKGAHPELRTMYVPRMSFGELCFDLEESLKALETDYIDIYFVHRDDVSRPVEEILENLEAFRKEGKIRHYGCSNWSLPRIIKAAETAAARGFEGFVCNQIRYGLGDINPKAISDKTTLTMDKPTYEYHQKTKMAVMAYTSSCNGYFSKKIKGEEISPSLESVYANEPNQMLLQKLARWEKEFNCPAAALVLAYTMSQDFPAAAIASFSSMGQLEEALPAGDFIFPQECLAEIRGIKRFLI